MAVPNNNNHEMCWFCVKAMKWIPVLFILTIVFWSYYAYVVELCMFTVGNIVKQIIYLLLYHAIFAMFIWSYWQTLFTKIGRVPDKFRLPDSEYDRLIHADNEDMQRQMLETFSRNLPNINRTVSGTVRYCDKCKLIKPDRTHHCSVCGECILKMDHHCPWVNNCVGFTNYKFFVLFLGYALIYCLYIALSSMEYFIEFWHGDLEGNGRFHILFLFFVALMFAISLISLFCYHCYLVLHNRTTLEAFRAPIFPSGPDKAGFDLGKFNNFREIFGDNPKLWFIPIKTSLGDGYSFRQYVPSEDSEQLISTHNYWDDNEAEAEVED